MIDKWYADNKVHTITTASENEGNPHTYFSPQRMLSVTLKRLVEDASVESIDYYTVPPSVEYILMEMGESFVLLLLNMIEWELRYQDKLISHRLKDMQEPEYSMLPQERCIFPYH